jgi:hypothetical protein
MIGMGVPPVEPIAGAESSIWPAIITAILFGTLLVATSEPSPPRRFRMRRSTSSSRPRERRRDGVSRFPRVTTTLYDSVNDLMPL